MSLRRPPRIDCGIGPGDALSARVFHGQIILTIRDPQTDRWISCGMTPKAFRSWVKDAIALSMIAEDYEGREV